MPFSLTLASLLGAHRLPVGPRPEPVPLACGFRFDRDGHPLAGICYHAGGALVGSGPAGGGRVGSALAGFLRGAMAAPPLFAGIGS